MLEDLNPSRRHVDGGILTACVWCARENRQSSTFEVSDVGYLCAAWRLSPVQVLADGFTQQEHGPLSRPDVYVQLVRCFPIVFAVP